MNLFLQFLAGACLCNFIPHLAAGLQGQCFPTPFARLHGSRVSSPVANVLWGSFNLGAGIALLHAHPIALELSAPLFSFAIGFVSLGVFLAWHFNRVMGHKRG
jgi:hypothetical protein